MDPNQTALRFISILHVKSFKEIFILNIQQ